MKGVCAPGMRPGGDAPGGGRIAAAPSLFMVICLHLPIRNAENAILPSLAAVIVKNRS